MYALKDLLGCSEVQAQATKFSTLRSPPHKCRGFRFSSPSIAFTFGIIAFQIRRSQAAFHGSSGSGSHGTLTVTIKASPPANVYRAHHVSMTFPSTRLAFIDSVV